MSDKIEVGDLVEFIGTCLGYNNPNFPNGTISLVTDVGNPKGQLLVGNINRGSVMISTDKMPFIDPRDGSAVVDIHISAFRKIPHEHATKDIGIRFDLKEIAK